MPFITVAPYKVVCHDRESVNGPDDFALAGAVIVDGGMAPFMMPDRSMTNNSVETFWPPAYSGYAQSLRIGMSLLAWDIDDNEKWKKARDDVKTYSEIASDLASALPPPFGDIAAGVLDNWPYVVDAFVSLDGNDQLIRWSGYFDVPLPAPNQSTYQEYEIRSKRTDPTGYSSWDYSVFVGISAFNSQPFTDTPTVRGMTPKAGSTIEQWCGRWEGRDVVIVISRSTHAITLLNISISWKVPRHVTTPATQTGYVRAASRINPAVQPPSVAGLSRDQKLMLSIGQTGSVVITNDSKGWAAALPETGMPRTSGGDAIFLAGGGVLEMFDELANGQPTNVRELRFFLPPAPGSVAVYQPVDEMLQAVVV